MKGKKRDKSNRGRYLSSLFVPTTPYDKEANIANLFINDKNELVCYDYNEHTNKWIPTKDIIKDDTIVEFAYIMSNDKHFRWIPIKNRHDKTFSYKKGVRDQKYKFNILTKYLEQRNVRLLHNEFNVIKYLARIVNLNVGDKQKIKNAYPSYKYIPVSEINYGNNFNTANSVWRSIHNPVTGQIITTGENIPDETEEKYYRRGSRSIGSNGVRFWDQIMTKF